MKVIPEKCGAHYNFDIYIFVLLAKNNSNYPCEVNSLIILSYLVVFPLFEFLLPGQKLISTLLSDILTIVVGVQSIFGSFLQLN
jgi:hypothetical protein